MLRHGTAHAGRSGFSLMELILVIFLITLLSAMAFPNLKGILPSSRLNTESRRLTSFLRQARLKAANTQKAVRVSINCIAHLADSSSPCRAIMETAVYSGGEFDDWQIIRDGRLIFNPKINIKAANSTWSTIDGSLLHSELVWLIFTPSSQIVTSFGPPANLTMWHGNVPHGGQTYDVTLNPTSGRVGVSQGNH